MRPGNVAFGHVAASVRADGDEPNRARLADAHEHHPVAEHRPRLGPTSRLEDVQRARELREVLLQTAVYAGVPAANRAFAVAQRTFDKVNDG